MIRVSEYEYRWTAAVTDLEALWNEHSQTPLPDDCIDAEIDGIDVGLLDTYAAGCVGAYLARQAIDADTLTILEASRRQLERVLPHLDGESAAYFGRLLAMAEAVSNAAH